MRILFILHYPPPVHGAAMVGQYIRESKTINDTFKMRYINLGTSRSVDEIGKGGFKKWGRYISLLWKTGYNIVSFRPNLVYLTLTAKGGGFYKDALVAIIAKALGGKLVYHFHNKGVSSRQDKCLDNLLYKIVFKNSDVILLSEYLYPDIQKYVIKDRVHICPNGIPQINQNLKIRTKKDNTKPIKLLFLSNLIETKGVFILLEACQILRNKGLNFHCSYVGGEGDITEENLKKNIKKSGLIEDVLYVGKKYGTDKTDVFSSANIFVHPTLNDCFPLVLLEAMQFSLPIISTNEGGVPGIVEDGKTGFLTRKNNPAELAEKLEVLIKDSNLRKLMGEAGRKKYEQEFTLETFENRFIKTLEKLV